MRNLLDPCFEVLQLRLQPYLNNPLACTGWLRPVSLTLEKRTIKHDTRQLIDIRTPCLRNGVLFEKFFVGNPNVKDNSGLGLSNLLVDEANNIMNWTKQVLRDRVTGLCIDGQ